MKCLEKDRARRYETATDLAQDIERHLNDEPVTARIPSFTYRTAKFISKHKLAVLSTAAIFVTLLAGLAVSTRLYFQEKTAWASEKVQRGNAEKSERAARIEAAKNARTAGFMAEMLAGIHPDSAKGRDVTLLSEILEHAAERVGAEMQDQPEVEADLRRTIEARTSSWWRTRRHRHLEARMFLRLTRTAVLLLAASAALLGSAAPASAAGERPSAYINPDTGKPTANPGVRAGSECETPDRSSNVTPPCRVTSSGG